MSGLETIKIIVDAEKEAEKLLDQSHARALEIKKELDGLILREREDKLAAARKEAASLLERAESESEREAVEYEKGSEGRIRELVERATAKKNDAIKALSDMLLE